MEKKKLNVSAFLKKSREYKDTKLGKFKGHT
jgi:hypothetical protein